LRDFVKGRLLFRVNFADEGGNVWKNCHSRFDWHCRFDSRSDTGGDFFRLGVG
jgi:hypothetical protein